MHDIRVLRTNCWEIVSIPISVQDYFLWVFVKSRYAPNPNSFGFGVESANRIRTRWIPSKECTFRKSRASIRKGMLFASPIQYFATTRGSCQILFECLWRQRRSISLPNKNSEWDCRIVVYGFPWTCDDHSAYSIYQSIIIHDRSNEDYAIFLLSHSTLITADMSQCINRVG